MTEEFSDKARQSKPMAMICEGTRMVEQEQRKNYSEQQVEDLAGKVASSTDKIVFVTQYSRDMDRFRSFYGVAKRNDRKIVISPKAAYLLSKLVDDKSWEGYQKCISTVPSIHIAGSSFESLTCSSTAFFRDVGYCYQNSPWMWDKWNFGRKNLE